MENDATSLREKLARAEAALREIAAADQFTDTPELHKLGLRACVLIAKDALLVNQARIVRVRSDAA
jgi:hypothetical protein